MKYFLFLCTFFLYSEIFLIMFPRQPQITTTATTKLLFGPLGRARVQEGFAALVNITLNFFCFIILERVLQIRMNNLFK